MKYPYNEQQLIALFTTLGARSPEQWVSYVRSDPEPALVQYLFMKQAWEQVIGDGQVTWIDEEIKRSIDQPNEPFSGLGQALNRMLAAGASRDDIAEVGRCLQAQLLFHLCYLLDGPSYETPGLEHIQWGLFRTDEDEVPYGDSIGGLNQLVLKTDPTGREMMPKNSFRDIS